MALEFFEKWHTAGDRDFPYISLHCIDISMDGHWLAAGGNDRVFILDADTGKLKVTLHQRSKVADIRWLKSKPCVLVCGFEDGMICTISLMQTKRGIVGLTYLWQPGHGIQLISLDPAGGQLATGSAAIRVWVMSERSIFPNWTNYRHLKQLDQDWGNRERPVVITGLHWRDSHSLVASYKHHGIQIWDVETATVLSKVISIVGDSEIGPSSLSSIYSQVAFAAGATYEVHQVDTRKFVCTFPNFEAEGTRAACGAGPLAFCLHEQALVARYNTTSARMWSMRDRSDIHTFVSPDSHRIEAIAAKDHISKVHDYAIAVASASVITLWVTRDTGTRSFVENMKRLITEGALLKLAVCLSLCVLLLAIVAGVGLLHSQRVADLARRAVAAVVYNHA